MIGLSPLSPGHRRTFQRTSVRPSTGSYPRFSLPRDSSPGFASAARDWNRPFRTRFRSGSLPSLTSPRASNSLAHSTKGTPSQDKPAPTPCGRTVSGTVSLFCSKCFSPFPHGTGSLSVSREYLALPDGPGRFTQNSSCSALLRIPLCFVLLRIPGCHRLRPNFPDRSSRKISCNDAVLQPRPCRNMNGLGSSPFARHYWGNHCYFLFLQVLRCFSSLR